MLKTTLDLEKSLPQGVLQTLKKIGKFGEGRGISVFLVGGVVRDLFLGFSNLDLDIVVEGDGVPFAKNLSSVLNSGIKTHSRFGTASLFFKDGSKLDIASARREVYPKPASLPLVAPGFLQDDLSRRDFTINSIALRLNGKGLGGLVDPFGGMKDLRKGLIRILHPKSFLDDPTRIFRAIRFECRFGFRIETQTLMRLKESLELEMLERLSPKRRRTEVFLLFKETDPTRPLLRLNELRALSHLHPKLSFPLSSVRMMKRLPKETRDWDESGKLDLPFLFFLLLTRKMKFEDRFALSRDLSFTKRERKNLLELHLVEGRLEHLKRTNPLVLHGLFKGMSPEILFFLFLKERDERRRMWIKEYWRVFRKVRLWITGRDLKALRVPEGPLYKVILDEVLRNRLDGKVETKEEELFLAKKIWEDKRNGFKRFSQSRKDI